MKMRNIYLLMFFLFALTVNAQKPFEELGLDNEVELLTLSDGRYVEHFTNDTLRQIGSVIFNTVTNKVAYFIGDDELEKMNVANRNREVSRFLSIDPFTDKNPSVSPYAFADNNPIIFIDQDGLFRMTKKMQKKYPQLTNLLKNIQQTVHNDPKTYEAFKETLGLTDVEANEILEWGKGPKVKVGITPNAYANTIMLSGNIKLDRKMIKILEGNKENPISEEGLTFLIYATVLHEGQHSAEALFDKTLLRDGEVYDAQSIFTEAGNVFEKKAFGEVINTSNADAASEINKIGRSIPLIMEREVRAGEMKGYDKPENQNALPLTKELGVTTDEKK